MCLEDNRIKQFFVARQRAVPTEVGVTLLLGSSPFRVGIVIGHDQGGSAVFGPDPGITAASGLLVNPTGGGLSHHLTYDDWGGAIQGEWFTIDGGALNFVSVTEILCPPQFWDVFLGISPTKLLPRIR